MSTAAELVGGPPPELRLPYARNPLRLVGSSTLWRAVGYLATYVFVTGWVLFSVAFTAATTALVFVITIAGIPLLTAAAEAMRGCATVERMRPGAGRLPEGDRGPHRPGQGALAGRGHLA